MSKKTSTALVPIIDAGFALSTEVSVDKEDVLAIAVSQAETLANDEIAQAMADAEFANKEIGKYDRLAQATVEVRGNEEWISAKADLETTLKSVDPKCSVIFSVSHAIDGAVTDDDDEGAEPARVYKTMQTKLYVSLDRCTSSTLCFTRKLKLPKAALAALKRRTAAGVAKEEALQRAYEWKRRLANIPLLERQARGKIAAHQLGRTEQGRAILEQLVGNIAKDVLALPHR